MTFCLHCPSTYRQPKFGLNRSGTQRYRCRECRRIFTPFKKKHSKKKIEKALKLCGMMNETRGKKKEGDKITYRRVARLLGVSPQTIINWVRKARVEELQRFEELQEQSVDLFMLEDQ